jgi:ubiquinone/menaquinone biosynthesis C-methylase UbiE
MTAIEKHFVNGQRNARAVAERTIGLLSYVQIKPGWHYLDVGCGIGSAAREIARKTGLDVTATDFDAKQISEAQKGETLPNLHYHVMDATKLSFRDAEFDIVASSMATHHIPNWRKAFDEMVRVLRIGGFFIYTELVFPSWLGKLEGLLHLVTFPSKTNIVDVAARHQLATIHEEREGERIKVIWRKDM